MNAPAPLRRDAGQRETTPRDRRDALSDLLADHALDLIVADECCQDDPTRAHLTRLVAFGGINVPGAEVRALERALNEICARAGFPPGEPFKWSPRRDHWMYTSLREDARRDFYTAVLACALKHGVLAHVAIEDCASAPAVLSAGSKENSCIHLFLERAETALEQAGTDAVLIVDTPGSDRSQESKFVRSCYSLLLEGTAYHSLRRIALVACGKSTHVRLLQLADLVTSCTTSRVAGETRFSPDVFDAVRPLLRSDDDRIGGVGLKIWPNEFRNLYHWLLGESDYLRAESVEPLPISGLPFQAGPEA